MTTGAIFIINDKTYHSYYDLGLKQLANVFIGKPEPKRHVIEDVPGIDGTLDITERFGEQRYNNREIHLFFETQDTSYDEWMKIISKISNALHGKKGKIILDIDANYYWKGYIAVEDLEKTSIVYSEVEIVIDAYPYKINLSTGEESL